MNLTRFRIGRKDTRYVVKYSATYVYLTKNIKCDIVNISEGGALLKIPQILLISDKINITIYHSNTIISVCAEVKHVNGMYVGVKFLYEEYDKYLIEDFIYKNAKHQKKIMMSDRLYDHLRRIHAI